MSVRSFSDGQLIHWWEKYFHKAAYPKLLYGYYWAYRQLKTASLLNTLSAAEQQPNNAIIYARQNLIMIHKLQTISYYSTRFSGDTLTLKELSGDWANMLLKRRPWTEIQSPDTQINRHLQKRRINEERIRFKGDVCWKWKLS